MNNYRLHHHMLWNYIILALIEDEQIKIISRLKQRDDFYFVDYFSLVVCYY